jgi:hypothetical protein
LQQQQMQQQQEQQLAQLEMDLAYMNKRTPTATDNASLRPLVHPMSHPLQLQAPLEIDAYNADVSANMEDVTNSSSKPTTL